MEPTRRGWAVAGAVLLAAPQLLYAAAAVGALLVGVAASFVRRLARERDALAVHVEAAPDDPLVDEGATLTLRAERPTADLPLRVVLSLPAAAEGDGPMVVELDSHESASFTARVTWPVAGTYRVGPARVVATDPLGLFVAAYESETTSTVRVRARQPSTVHLGHGGDRVGAAFGEHRASRPGGGIEPAKLSRYEPGADVSRIDWKATARLDEVYVVEPETDTDRQTVLLLDHRASMGLGEGTTTPLAYLRHAALAIVGSARELGDPIGAYAVGDRGVTLAEPPSVGPVQYAYLEDAIRTLDATARDDASGAGGDGPVDSAAEAPPDDARTAAPSAAAAPDAPVESSGTSADSTSAATSGASADSTNGSAGSTTGSAGSSATAGSAAASTASPADVATAAAGATGAAPALSATAPTRVHGAGSLGTRAATRLSDGDDEFARTLRPFVADETQYLHRVESEQLFAAARTYLRTIRGSLWTVVVTDDSRRDELRETVKVARRANDRVLVVLAPRVLFEPGGLSELDRAYERYRAFESFRRELAAMDRVDAMELAPGERVESVIAAGGDRE